MAGVSVVSNEYAFAVTKCMHVQGKNALWKYVNFRSVGDLFHTFPVGEETFALSTQLAFE
jgi:hypothetical protein